MPISRSRAMDGLNVLSARLALRKQDARRNLSSRQGNVMILVRSVSIVAIDGYVQRAVTKMTLSWLHLLSLMPLSGAWGGG